MFTLRVSNFISSSLGILFFLVNTSVAQAAEQQTGWVTASYAQVEEQRVLDATVEAVHQATISAQTSGRVLKINVDVDDKVSKGDILIQFRNKEQQAAYNAAKATFDEAEAEYKRVQDIFSKKLVAKAALDKASARFKSARAGLEQATEALENTVVRAPYSGIVVKRHIEVGELANPGRQLMTGLSLEALRARVDLPQDLVSVVREKNKALAILQTGQRIPIEKITVSPYADEQSHTFQMRADLPKGDYGIYPGMFIKLAIVTGIKQSLVVPAAAIARRSEVSAVYVLGDDNRLSFRQVRVGKHIPDSDSYEILAGLEENEKVMLDPVAAAAQLKLQE
ncbi:MAG: efflux RND transporter periplasmic adaptor subunit [Thioalkalispiraceae bacterium]|jgi:RND family efflux transporter MFP subunit